VRLHHGTLSLEDAASDGSGLRVTCSFPPGG